MKLIRANIKKALPGICLLLSACVLTACGGSNPDKTSSSEGSVLSSEGSSQAVEEVLGSDGQTLSESVAESFSDSAKSIAQMSGTGAMNGTVYTSANGLVQIDLPDSSWEVTDDMDSFISFLSGGSSITISHFDGENASPLLESIPQSQEDYEAGLGNSANLSEVKQFEYGDMAEGNFRYTKIAELKKDPSSPVQSQICYTCYFPQEVYVVTALLDTADEKAMKKAEESVYSFQVN